MTNYKAKKRIGCSVILYNPSDKCIKNILSYIDSCEIAFIFDNSPISNIKNIIKILGKDRASKIRYYPNYRNLGISKCLNMSIKNAINEKLDYLLTMDQDSFLYPGAVKGLVDILEENKNAAIAAPRILIEGRSMKISKSHIVITSGSLISIEKIKNSNIRYEEDFFIDKIDDAFCIEIRACGYDIIIAESIYMEHSLGENGHYINNMYISNHSPLRRYYITRNSVYILKKYYHHKNNIIRKPLRAILLSIPKDLIKIIVFENNRFKKGLALIIGIKDAFAGRRGKRWIV